MLKIGTQEVTPSVKNSTKLYIGSNFIGPMKTTMIKPQTWYNWLSSVSYEKSSSDPFYYYFRGQQKNNIKSFVKGNCPRTIGLLTMIVDGQNLVEEISDGVYEYCGLLPVQITVNENNYSVSTREIYYLNGKFFAYGGRMLDDGYEVAFLTSTDLTNWNTTVYEAEVPLYNDYFNAFICNNKLIMFYQDLNENYHCLQSTDLVNFSDNIISGFSGDAESLAYGNGKYIIARDYSAYQWKSTDLINWTRFGIDSGNYVSNVRYFKNKFIGFGREHTYYHVSNDGDLWTKVNLDSNFNPIGDNLKDSCQNSKTLYIYCSSQHVYYTNDLVNWNNFETTESYYTSQFITNENDNLYSYPVNNSNVISKFEKSADECFTLTETPDTSSKVYSTPTIESSETITSVGQSSITLSNEKVYNRNAGGDVVR